MKVFGVSVNPTFGDTVVAVTVIVAVEPGEVVIVQLTVCVVAFAIGAIDDGHVRVKLSALALKLTCAESEAVVSTWLVAVTVTELRPLIFAGAV